MTLVRSPLPIDLRRRRRVSAVAAAFALAATGFAVGTAAPAGAVGDPLGTVTNFTDLSIAGPGGISGTFFVPVQWMAETGLSTGSPNSPGKPFVQARELGVPPSHGGILEPLRRPSVARRDVSGDGDPGGMHVADPPEA